MPAIPEYQQRVGAQGNAGPGAPRIRTELIADAGEDFQRNFDAAQAKQEREIEEASLVTATSDLQSARAHWSEQFTQRQAAAPEGAAGFTAGVLKDFDTDMKERVGKARTERAREYLANRLGEVRLGLQEDAQRFELQSGIRSKQSGLERSTESARTAASFRPQDHDKILSEQMLAIAGSGLPDDQRAAAALLATRAIGEAAVEGMIRRDPYGTLKEINNEKSKVTALSNLTLDQRDRARSAAQSEINRREAEARARRAEAQDTLRGDVEDAFAARAFGMPATLPSRDRFVAAYGADGADRYNSATKQWAVFDVVGEAAFQPPAEAMKTLDRLKPATQEGAAEQGKAYEQAVKLYGSQRKQLESNPVETLTRADPFVREAAMKAAQDPAQMGAYLDALKSKQQVLGVAEPKLLAEAQREQLAARLTWDPNAPRRRTEALGELRAVYGSHYNDVIREVAPKLDGMARVMIHMNPTEAARLDGAYAQAEAFKTSATVQAAMKDLRPAIDAQLSDLAGTLSDNPDGLQRHSEHVEAATIYAQELVFRGASPEAAARTAADAVINSQFTYRDMLRIPKPLNDSRVVTALGVEKDTLSKKGEFTIETSAFSTAEQSQEDMRNVIREMGYWITNESGDGAVLRIPHRQGSGEVYRKDGSRVEYKFKDLAERDLSGISLYVPFEGY